MRRPLFRTTDGLEAAARLPAGLWSLDGDALANVERFDVGPAIVLVPGEQVLLTVADLPLPGLRRRAEALPFAIEDRIAAPLAAVHVALGAEIAPRRHLAGVVAHDLMRYWTARLVEAGLDHAALVPDVLALPVPEPGGWSVDLAGPRAMVRSEDGGGFAIPADHLEAAWEGAGRPRCLAYGEPLPFGAPAELAPAPLADRLARAALDLRQGAYAAPRRPAASLWKRITTIAAIGVVAQGAIAAADTLALDHIAARRAAETRALLATVAPGADTGGDLAGTVAAIVPAGGAGPSAFLPLLSRVALALKPLGPGLALRSIAFDGAAASLSVEVETGDMGGLQRVGAALGGAGLSVLPGAASQDQGKAVGAFLIRAGA